MATAAAPLEWQPLMRLQHENYQLREENRHLHWQVTELLDWKARAVRHMVALAPKRSKTQRERRRIRWSRKSKYCCSGSTSSRMKSRHWRASASRKSSAKRSYEQVEQTFTQQQQKAELYEAQHAELEQLRSKVESVQQTHLESASKYQHYRVQVTRLQHVNTQLENELGKFQTRCVEHSHTQNQLGDQMRLLVTEIRQYLLLVRVEIKKKFGYVPEAIAHASPSSLSRRRLEVRGRGNAALVVVEE